MFRKCHFIAALAVLLLIVQAVSPAFSCLAADSRPMQDEVALYTQYLQQKGYSDILGYSEFDDPYPIEVTEEIDDIYSISTCLIDLNRDGVCELLITLEDNEMYMSRSALMTIADGAVKQVAAAGHDGGSLGGSYLQLKYNSLLGEYTAVKTSSFRDGSRAFYNFFSIYSNDALFTLQELNCCGFDLSSEYSVDADAIRTETDRCLVEDGYLYAFMLDDEYISATVYDTLMNGFADPDNPDEMFAQGSYASPITGPAFTNGAGN